MKIKVDETNLAAAHVMPLFEAAQKIADMTGEVVLIETFYGIMFEPALKDEIDAPVMPNIEPHKWPDLNDPFAVDWSKAPDDATHHAFDSAEKELKGHWYKGHPAKDNEEFLSHGSAYHIEASGFILPACLADRWHESLTKRPVPCTITTSSLLKDQVDVRN